MTPKISCRKCGAFYWDDGYMWCPDCDVAFYVGKAAFLPNASENVRKMRQESQEAVRLKYEGELHV